MSNNDKGRRDLSPGSSMMAMVVRMATSELPRESPSFTRLPNFRHTGPPASPVTNTSLTLPSSPATQRRNSFGLSSLFSSPLTRRRNQSPSFDSGASSPGVPSQYHTLPPSEDSDVERLPVGIRSRIRELSANTKRRKELGEESSTNLQDKNGTTATNKTDVPQNQKPLGNFVLSNGNNYTEYSNGNGKPASRTQSSNSMASREGSERRKLDKPRFLPESETTNRRKAGLGGNLHENSFMRNVAFVNIEEEGDLNQHELDFLRYSAEGNLEEVRKIFEEQTYYLFHLDVNCVDSLDRTALSLALLNRHIEIVGFLLSDEVVGIEFRDALFYAIQCEFHEAIDMLLDKDAQTSAQIEPGTTSPFEPGLTPFMLAANKNNYKILAKLYQYNHRLTVSDDEVLEETSDTYSWDAVMSRLLYFRARASPAFMLLMYNEKGMAWDPLNTAMDLFGELKLLAKREREVDEAYLQMAEQCEKFALQLLQEVRSASELADLMRYDLDDDPDDDDDPGETDRVIIRKREKMRNYLKPIEKAIKYKMKDFVTSDNSQLALIYIQKGSMFRKLKGWKATVVQAFLGLMFPVLCIAFLISPDSKFGRLMRNPTVKFGCSVVSELIFVFLLLANTIITQTTTTESGVDEIPLLLNIACVWIAGKFLQEVREVYQQGLREYLSDVWNWNDVFVILLFTGYIVLRLIHKLGPGVVDHHHGGKFSHPDMWDPIPLSDICISIAYILIHLRILELLRADRRFGPLQVSLDLMTRDAIRFFVIFFIIYLAFGSGITELYAPFGTDKGCVCDLNCTAESSNGNLTTSATSEPQCVSCKSVDNDSDQLTTFQGSLVGMYWTLFGYGEPRKWLKLNCHNGYESTYWVGTAIIFLYHIIAIIVLVNMLIAMMSNSFQKTHDDSEREWKFHRTQLWLKFIRNEINQPPPMNLIPRPKQIRHLMRSIAKSFRKCHGRKDTSSSEEEIRMQKQIQMQRRRTGFDSSKMSNCLAGALYEGETRYSKVLRLVVIRYLKKKVLNNEMVI